jgi:hypothetical protein
LDLQTVTNSVDTYETLADFWADVFGIFENAIAYHASRPTKWIANIGKEMLKVVKKEKAKKTTLKIKLSPSEAAAPVAGPPKMKKISLKLKLPTQQNLKEPHVQLAPIHPVSSTPFKDESKHVIKAKPTQPKLKLKLSLGKKKDSLKAPDAASSSTNSVFPAVTEKSKGAEMAKPKITLNLGGSSRGKELPKGVASDTTSLIPVQPPPTKPKSKKKKAPSTQKSASSVALLKGTSPKLVPVVSSKSFPTAQAYKILLGLKRRQSKSILWFLQPVSDKVILADYKAKVKNPMDINTMTVKLEQGSYTSVSAFLLDLRRIFSNCLKYNTSIKDSLRPVAVEVLQTAEELAQVFFAGHSYPRLLPFWRLMVNVLDTLLNLVNPEDGQPTAFYFLHPVSYYCGGQFPPDYLQMIGKDKAIDFGTVTAK